MAFRRIHEQRIATVERTDEAAVFSGIMATEGEASDGHILSIKGARLPKALPLQADHANSVLANLGRMSDFEKATKESPPVLRGMGRIRLTGEGAQRDVRADVVDAIETGDVTGLSIRWEDIRSSRRINLPSDHPAFVDSEREKDWRKRFGMFFHEWEALEESVVAIPADRAAQIGRAELAAVEGVSAFWRGLVDGLDQRQESDARFEAMEACYQETATMIRDLNEKFESFQRAALPPRPTPDASAEGAPGERTTLSRVFDTVVTNLEGRFDRIDSHAKDRLDHLRDLATNRVP